MPQVIAQKAAETDAMIVPWYPGIPFGPEVYLMKKKNISISSVSISKDWLELQRPDFFEDMMMYNIYIYLFI